MPLMFFYGTLRRGFGNNRLLDGAKFLRTDSLKGTLYTSGPNGRGIPFLFPGNGTVQGELFEVPERLLPRLDALEGHPTAYTREKRLLDSGEEAEVYAYNHPESIRYLHLLPSGNYGENYSMARGAVLDEEV